MIQNIFSENPSISVDSSSTSKTDQTGQLDASMAQLVAKEHFVFTDPEGQLYHFSVEGNTIRDGTKVGFNNTKLGRRIRSLISNTALKLVWVYIWNSFIDRC